MRDAHILLVNILELGFFHSALATCTHYRWQCIVVYMLEIRVFFPSFVFGMLVLFLDLMIRYSVCVLLAFRPSATQSNTHYFVCLHIQEYFNLQMYGWFSSMCECLLLIFSEVMPVSAFVKLLGAFHGAFGMMTFQMHSETLNNKHHKI